VNSRNRASTLNRSALEAREQQAQQFQAPLGSFGTATSRGRTSGSTFR